MEKPSESIIERSKKAFEGQKALISAPMTFKCDYPFLGGATAITTVAYANDLNILQIGAIAYATAKSAEIGTHVCEAAQKVLHETLSDRRPAKAFIGAVIGAVGVGYYGHTLTHDLVTGAWLPQDSSAEHTQSEPDTVVQRRQDLESGVMVIDHYTFDFS